MPNLRVQLNKLSSDWQVARALLEDEYIGLDKTLNKFRTRYEFAKHLLDVHRMWCVRRAIALPSRCLPGRSDGETAHAVQSKNYVSASTQTDHGESSQEMIKDEDHREEGSVDTCRLIVAGGLSNLQDIPDQHSTDLQSNFEKTNPDSDLHIKQEVVSEQLYDVHLESSMNESTSEERHKDEIPTPHSASDTLASNQGSNLLIKHKVVSYENHDVHIESSRNESTNQLRHEEGLSVQHKSHDVESHLERINSLSDIFIKQEEEPEENHGLDVEMDTNELTSHHGPESISHQGPAEGIDTQHTGSDAKANMDIDGPSRTRSQIYNCSSVDSFPAQCDADWKTILDIGGPSRTTSQSYKCNSVDSSPGLCDADGKTILDIGGTSRSTNQSYKCSSVDSSTGLCDTDVNTILDNTRKPSRSPYDNDKRSCNHSHPDLRNAGISSNKNLHSASPQRPNKRHLTHSTRTLSLEKRFGCNFCSFRCCQKSRLTIHMRKHAGEMPFKCSLCSFRCSQKDSLVCHLRTHRGEKPFLCSICKKGFTCQGSLSRHMRIHTGEKPFECGLCSFRFSQKAHLKSHMRTHTGEKPYHCPVCNKAFTQGIGLSRHMKTHTREKTYNCSVCNQAFTDHDELLSHMRTHTNEKSFQCSLCNFKCSHKDSLVFHIRTHTREKPIQCSICKKGFTCKAMLSRHMRIHTGERPFECGFCSYRCTQKGHLKSHMRTHTGEKPYHCPVCNKAFAQRNKISCHMKTHTGEKPFLCRLCSFKCSDKSNLTSHMRTHTGKNNLIRPLHRVIKSLAI